MNLAMEIGALTPFVFSLFVFFIFLQQLNYLKKKRFVPGPNLIVPFLGGAIELARNPTRFWDNQAAAAKSSDLGFSANYIFGRFILFISKTDLSHKIFTNVRPDAFHLIGHPFGKKLFGEHNMIYMFGEHHKDLRRRIAPNFTPKALSIYSSLQQKIILKHLKRWVHLSKSGSAPVSLRLLCRDMNLETSQTVFAGPYLDSKTRDAFNDDYNLFNVGLMKLPVDLPGFAFRKARLAVGRLVKTLAKCATESKSKVKSGAEPSCLVDFWMQETLKEIEAAEIEGNQVPPPHSSDEEIGGHIFDFLFAAQDASTSSLLWAVSLLESHPEVLKKVREEVASIWNWESDTLITAEQLKEMKYTASVVREIVRFRPPATMVPHIAGEEFQLTENYTIPKGTIVFPSLFESSFQGFTESTRFDPDRFSETRQEDRLFKKNFLSFGAGAHQCAGQRYALNHLTLFVALFTSLVNFEREKCNGRDDILYVPTICPKDECKVYLSQRCTRYPSF